jgi:hypothetical protein
MNDAEKQAKIETHRQRIQTNNEAWLAWSKQAADLSVDELLKGNVIRPDQVDFASRIFAQQLHLLLVGGSVPPS